MLQCVGTMSLRYICWPRHHVLHMICKSGASWPASPMASVVPAARCLLLAKPALKKWTIIEYHRIMHVTRPKGNIIGESRKQSHGLSHQHQHTVLGRTHHLGILTLCLTLSDLANRSINFTALYSTLQHFAPSQPLSSPSHWEFLRTRVDNTAPAAILSYSNMSSGLEHIEESKVAISLLSHAELKKKRKETKSIKQLHRFNVWSSFCHSLQQELALFTPKLRPLWQWSAVLQKCLFSIRASHLNNGSPLQVITFHVWRTFSNLGSYSETASCWIVTLRTRITKDH